MSRTTRKRIAMDTLKQSHMLSKERLSSYYCNDIPHRETNKYDSDLKLEVVNQDVVSVLTELNTKEEKVAVLSFGSARNPGGGFLKGSNAQEEALCRSSDLYLYLKDNDFYNNPKHYENGLYDNDLIYSKNVTFFKDKNGEPITDFNVDVITATAVNKNFIIKSGELDLLVEVDSEMTKRISNIFDAALANDVDVLVLGAFGTGVFGNDPYKVKGYFEHLLNTKYKKSFKKVIFAVLEDKKEPINKYLVFKDMKI